MSEVAKSGSNKNLIYVAIGGAVVVGAALLFHLLGSKSEEAVSNSKVLEEIDALGPAKREMNGMLAFGYYK